jgi:ribosomal protein S18 acetylase RimI-like enzyme
VEEFEIRTATQEDAAAIAAVLAAAFVEYEPLYTTEGYAATTPGEAVIKNRFTEGKTWIAEVAGRVVGTVSVVPQAESSTQREPLTHRKSVAQPESLYIRSMAILPEARGHRLGEHLLSEIEHYAFAQGFRRLTLSTTPFLDRAIRLYEKFGFTRCGSDDLFGTPLITMAKEIK